MRCKILIGAPSRRRISISSATALRPSLSDQPIKREGTIEGTKVEFRELHHMDSLHGHMHIDLHATVYGLDGGTEIDHEEVLRITTVNEMRMLLSAAGFESVQVYPHHELPDEPEDNPEQLWFVALREA